MWFALSKGHRRQRRGDCQNDCSRADHWSQDGNYWKRTHQMIYTARRPTLGVRDLHRKYSEKHIFRSFGKSPVNLFFKWCFWQSVLSRMGRMTVRTFLVWKFPEIRHMESILTYQLWFRWELFVEKRVFYWKSMFFCSGTSAQSHF